MIAAIILAAGESARMGFPKALLSYRGETFLTGILKACYGAGLDRRVVVLGHHAGKIMRGVALDDVIVTRSQNLTAGPIGSIRAGIDVLAEHPVDAILVWPVDRPHVASTTVQLLIDAFRREGKPVVLPVHRGRRGHPVVFGRDVFDELIAAPDDVGARSVVRADPERVCEVSVRDAAVLDDVNTPADYRELLRREEGRDSTESASDR